MTALKLATPFELDNSALAQHQAKLKREEEVEKFFSERTLRTADAILWESGVELSLTPKD